MLILHEREQTNKLEEVSSRNIYRAIVNDFVYKFLNILALMNALASGHNFVHVASFNFVFIQFDTQSKCSTYPWLFSVHGLLKDQCVQICKIMCFMEAIFWII